MKITISDTIPDMTYFSLSDVAPDQDENRLVVYTGKGSRRSWGTPGVQSAVVVNTATFTAVHVSFHHKHRGGQGWFYYVKSERRVWAQLDERRQKQVLAALSKAPSWAKAPGKLKSERTKSAVTGLIAYKLVQVQDGSLRSIHDAEIVYEVGRKVSEPVKSDKRGGYYAFQTRDQAEAMAEWPMCSGVDHFALLEVRLDGKTIQYGGGKIAATHLTPLRILNTIDRARQA